MGNGGLASLRRDCHEPQLVLFLVNRYGAAARALWDHTLAFGSGTGESVNLINTDGPVIIGQGSE
jgi:hypothetical protein